MAFINSPSTGVGVEVEATSKAARALLYAADGSVLVGQKTMAASVPVVVASDQTVPVSLTLGSNLPVTIADLGSLDAFGRFRVSQPLNLFASKHIYDAQTLLWDDQQTSGGSTASAWQSAHSAVRLTVDASVAGTRTRQTFRRFNYQPGKSQAAFLSANLIAEGGSGNAAVARRVGLFDSANGFFFECHGSTMRVALRTASSGSPVTTYVDRANWNLDKLDGTGASGLTLAPAMIQIFVIDFQWLGAGRIRYGVDIGGKLVYVHEWRVANLQTAVSIATPNLPIRYEIVSDGSGGAASCFLHHVCSAVFSEGGAEDVGLQFSVDTGATPLVTGNDTSVRAMLALQFQSGKVGAEVFPTMFTAASITATAQFKVALYLNPTIAGGALSYAAVPGSTCQFAIGATANTLTNGTQIYSAIVQQNKAGGTIDRLALSQALGSTIAGVSDTLVLAIQALPASATTVYGSLSWQEAA